MPPTDTTGCFFISYACEDKTYVTRLAGRLRAADLPVWYDADIAVGARFPREIQTRIADALAVIVVMSDASKASFWVELEILEGQRRDRPFFPILLGGEILFLLGSSQYFDADEGKRLPGERELRQLRAILDDKLKGSGRKPPIKLAAAAGRRRAPTAHAGVDVSLGKLRSFIDDGNLANADIFTTSLLLEAVGRVRDGWMRITHGEELPFDLLADIDEAWSAQSSGEQGFRAQLACHRHPPRGAESGSEGDFSALAASVGWKRNIHDIVPRYGEFVRTKAPPSGFFPTFRNPQLERNESWYENWRATAMAVHRQLRRWEGQR